MSTNEPDPGTDVLVRTAIGELCRWCETVLTEWQDPARLAGLHDLSGHVFHLAEDYTQAARHWERAAEIHRERLASVSESTELAHARADLVSVLETLSRHYHDTQRPAEAIQPELELVDLVQTGGDAIGIAMATAQALARVGATMLAADRYAEAEDHLTRADHAFLPFDNNYLLARDHTRVLTLLAEAHRHQDHPAEVHRSERRAIEVAAVPLAPAAVELHNLNDLITALVEELSPFATQVADLAAHVPRDQPSPDHLARIPAVVATWPDVAKSLDSKARHLLGHVNTILDAAGLTPNTRSQPTLLDAVHDLAEWVTQAAITRGLPDVMIGILDRSAQLYRLAGDFTRAESQWSRALHFNDALVRRASDDAAQRSARARSIAILQSRDELYHAWGLFDKAMDMELALVEEHRTAGDRPGFARALARLGATYVAVGRPDSAETYLSEADAAFHALGQPLDPAEASAYASTLELLATVHIHCGHPIKASRCRARARALRVPQSDAAPDQQ